MTHMVDIAKLFAPKVSDKLYIQKDQLKISLILRTDSYKFAHPFAYPDINIEAMTSYGVARVKRSQVIVPFGMQLFVKKYLTETITMDDVNAAESFAMAHFGRPLFDRKSWEKVVNVYNGKLPLVIRAVPEGMKIAGGLPMYTVSVFDRDLFWMSAAFETMIQRGNWYPTTIATKDYEVKQKLIKRYEDTDADMTLLPFAEHDFAGRGVTCGEQAEIGGAAHLVNFMGSDTIEGIVTANYYYNIPMAGFSVFATEHAVQCSFGGGTEDAKRYIRKVLKNASPGTIVSIVIDGYDVYREAELLCTEFKDDIIASGAKVVFRPDSGDMFEVVPRLLKLQEMAFGYTLTKTGHKKINHVGLIQGDGIDSVTLIELLDKVIGLGYTASVIVFGSGGGLLQKVNRDTYKFAQKACAILVDGKWVGIAKDPVTDPGKKSEEGVLTTVRSKATGELMVARLDLGPIDSDFEDIMILLYSMGDLYNETTMDEIRKRVNS